MSTDKTQAVNPKMFKVLREKTGMTQEQLAKELGIARPDLSKIERGLTIPDWLVRFVAVSRVIQKSGLTWEDVIMDSPPPKTLRTVEKKTEYKV